MLYFCVACERPGHEKRYVEVLARSEKHAVHQASQIHPDHKYRLLLPEPVVNHAP